MTPRRIEDQYSSLPIFTRYRARRIAKGLCCRSGCTSMARENRRECLVHARESSERVTRVNRAKREVSGEQQTSV